MGESATISRRGLLGSSGGGGGGFPEPALRPAWMGTGATLGRGAFGSVKVTTDAPAIRDGRASPLRTRSPAVRLANLPPFICVHSRRDNYPCCDGRRRWRVFRARQKCAPPRGDPVRNAYPRAHKEQPRKPVTAPGSPHARL